MLRSVLLLIVLSLSFVGCERPRIVVDTSRSPNRHIGAAAPSPVAGESTVCENTADEICGPFSDELRKLCEQHGGGEPCRSDRWSRAFYDDLAGALSGSSSSPAAPEPAPSSDGSLAGLIVAIDVGHGVYAEDGGGWDPGAVNPVNREITEHRENWRQAKAAEEVLRARGAEVRVYSHDLGSQALTLRQKGALAKGSHVFVSMHKNAAKGNAQGTEVWVVRQPRPAERRLAELVQARMVKSLWGGSPGGKDRGVKERSFSVLLGAEPVVQAAILTEAYFIDAPLSADQAAEYSELSGRAVADGIADYWLQKRVTSLALAVLTPVCQLMPQASVCQSAR